MSAKGWVGIDLDGTMTLGYQPRIGAPVPQMLDIARTLLAAGIEVRIFTARASGGRLVVEPVKAWSKAVFGRALPVTNVKTMDCLLILDDKALSVAPHTGRFRTPDEQLAVLRELLERHGA